MAARDLDIGIVLVGPEAEMRSLAASIAGGEAVLSELRISFEDAPEAIGMDEVPLTALRKKKRSSILVGLRLVRDGRGDAFVSAGNTGAVMAAAVLVLRRLAGCERAALAATLPTTKGHSVLLDVGANVEVRAQHLEQFAVMGSCFCSALGVASPRVALLSVGEEEMKGNDLIRKVHQDLKRGPVNFIGNIDGKDVFTGHADVIVTDGFTGNAVLKASESLIMELATLMRREIRSTWRGRLGGILLRPVFKEMRRKLDHAEYGAVPLLGVNGAVFIGHGSSSAKSIRSALRVAKTFVDARVNDAIERQLQELAAAAADPAPEAEGLPREPHVGGAHVTDARAGARPAPAERGGP